VPKFPVLRRTENYACSGGPPHRPTTAEHLKRIGKQQISSPIQNEIIQRSTDGGDPNEEKLALCEGAARDGARQKAREPRWRVSVQTMGVFLGPSEQSALGKQPQPGDRQFWPGQAVRFVNLMNGGAGTTSDYERFFPGVGQVGAPGCRREGATDPRRPVKFPRGPATIAPVSATECRNNGPSPNRKKSPVGLVHASQGNGNYSTSSAGDHHGAVGCPDVGLTAVVSATELSESFTRPLSVRRSRA